MDSSKEFREFALQCMRWAEETRDERHRQVLLDLGKQWMRASLAVKKTISLIDDEVPLVPGADKPRADSAA